MPDKTITPDLSDLSWNAIALLGALVLRREDESAENLQHPAGTVMSLGIKKESTGDLVRELEEAGYIRTPVHTRVEATAEGAEYIHEMLDNGSITERHITPPRTIIAS